MFREPFQPLADAGLPPLVLDGEIAMPDERGVTHIDALTEALRQRRPSSSPISPSTSSTSTATICARAQSKTRKALLRDVMPPDDLRGGSNINGRA